jgi:hypothetical protein
LRLFAVHVDDGSGESVAGAAPSFRIVHPIVDLAGRIVRLTAGNANGWWWNGRSTDGRIPAGLRAPVPSLVVLLGSLVGITSDRSCCTGLFRQDASPPDGEQLPWRHL